MVAPLKVGLAGLGTVGASVVRLIDAAARDAWPRAAAGRIEIVAVSARSRGKDRGIDLKKLRWVADPVELASDPGDRRLRRTDRRGGRSGACRGRGGAQSRQVGGHRQQGAAGAPRRRACGARREAQRRAQFRSRGRRRHPDRQDVARGACRQRHRAHLRHPQRHLQLHPHAHGAGAAVVRRMPEGSAAARLCRGRSDLRHRRPRHRAEACDPGEPGLRHPGRSEGDLCRGHHLDRHRRSRCRRGARLPHQAARRRGEDRQGHRAARAPDHGAERIPPSPRSWA